MVKFKKFGKSYAQTKQTSQRKEIDVPPKESATETFTKVTGIIIACITIFGAGYATASIISSLEHKMEIIELTNEYERKVQEEKNKLEESKKTQYLTKDELEVFFSNYNKDKDGKK